LDAAVAFAQDMRVGLRSLLRTRGLAATVVVTLALGIGANAAIFSVVRGVLLRPLVNRGEDRLIYVRQSAPGIGAENLTFSVPEIADVRARATTIAPSATSPPSTSRWSASRPGSSSRSRDGSFFDVSGCSRAGRL
jgi:hypothetical protein